MNKCNCPVCALEKDILDFPLTWPEIVIAGVVVFFFGLAVGVNYV